MTRKLTVGILIAVVAALIGYDVWVYREATPGDTISEVVLSYGRRFATIPFGIGVLCGHFFLPRRREPFGWVRRKSITVLAYLGGFVLASDAVGTFAPHALHPVIPFLIGFPLGAILWGQVEKERA